MKLSKRPFRDSNCRYAFRLATGAGALDLLAMPALYSTQVRSRGRRLPPTLQKKSKSMDEVRKST